MIIDGASGAVTGHFSAGTVALEGIDTEDDGVLSYSNTLDARPREPGRASMMVIRISWPPKVSAKAMMRSGDAGGGPNRSRLRKLQETHLAVFQRAAISRFIASSARS
ncbi:hypothetical protein [Aureimonas altamirensis]|uniref:hypothetical protein n=1 Tax=Aureimonas altamirensis TaxID=370622 RepID=UPI000B2AB88F